MWYCSKCKIENDGDLCSNCGEPRPKSDDEAWAELIGKVQLSLCEMGLPELKGTHNAPTGGWGYRSTPKPCYMESQFIEYRKEPVTMFETESEEEMLFYMLDSEASSYGFDFEYKNRAQLEREWRGSVRYDFRKIWFELQIQYMSKVCPPDRLERLIRERTRLMNRWFRDDHWGFDRNKMEFIELTKSPEQFDDKFLDDNP